MSCVGVLLKEQEAVVLFARSVVRPRRAGGAS